MSVLIRMICIDAIDSFPCIVVVTENSRILFDVGEGVQRLCVEHGVKLGKVSNIFVTRFSNSTICGIPGM
jgi:ribonuclease Z